MTPLSQVPTLPEVRQRLATMQDIPSLQKFIRPVMECLDQPLESVDINQIAEIISCDKAITAQCLRMANSALFSLSQHVDSIRGAIVALGLRRVRDIVLSCRIMRLTPRDYAFFHPERLWRHSLGCALVTRKLSRRLAFPDADKVYLAALLHDIGELVNLLLFPHEFSQVVEIAGAEHIALYQAEERLWQLTHCQTGLVLAEQWGLPPEVNHTIAWHHHIDLMKGTPETSGPVVALVTVADELCRYRGLGPVPYEAGCLSLEDDPAWLILRSHFPSARRLDLARFTMEMDSYLEEVKKLVAALLYGSES